MWPLLSISHVMLALCFGIMYFIMFIMQLETDGMVENLVCCCYFWVKRVSILIKTLPMVFKTSTIWNSVWNVLFFQTISSAVYRVRCGGGGKLCWHSCTLQQFFNTSTRELFICSTLPLKICPWCKSTANLSANFLNSVSTCITLHRVQHCCLSDSSRINTGEVG